MAGCDTSLRTGLDDRQADDMLASLRHEGIRTDKERGADGKWSLAVAEHDLRDAERIVQRYELPRDAHPRVPDLFPGTGLMPSQLEEHIRYQYALGQELAATIERIDGVVSASVQVALPMEDKRKTERVKPGASVFVRYRSDQRVDLMRTQIRNLVAHALPEGVEDQVVVFTLPVAPIVRVGAITDVHEPASGRDRQAPWYGVAGTYVPWLMLPLLAWFAWRLPLRERVPQAWRRVWSSLPNRRSARPRR